MSSRALSLATVLLLIGFGASDAVLAQATNLEAGKAPSQIFAQTCNACHKSPRGLLKTIAPGSLPGFLRQHYTTSPDMAGVLASYLVSNGATDARYQSKDGAKDGKDKKDGAKEKDANTNPAQSPDHQGRRQRSQEAAKPEGEGASPAPEGRQKRAARPSDEGAKEEGAKPEGQAASEQPPEGRKAKRLSKRGKPETEDAAAPSSGDKKGEPKTEPKSDSAKVDSGRDESKPENGKASEKPAEAKPESAKVEPSTSEAPALRPDPVPAVTPAPPAAAAKPAEPVAPKPAEVAAPKSAEPATSGSSEPAAKPQESAPPATAAAPPPAPAEQSGPPAPPISR
ncbi:MAG TPA: hypothetical protein VF901_06035 [Bradyrhizobium sp.]